MAHNKEWYYACMRTAPWDSFFKAKMAKIFTEKKVIVDIGGGLRVDAQRNNRGNQNPWLKSYVDKVDYKILDKVPDYHPDIVGDVHDLPLKDASVDAVICIALLEHVEEPHRAMKEIYRVLKPGGYLFVYVPFLYYYHPMPGYYGDFYRFTYDGLKYLTRDFKEVEIQNVRGAFETVMNLFPFFSKRSSMFNFLDRLFLKEKSKQTSGYNVFCVK